MHLIQAALIFASMAPPSFASGGSAPAPQSCGTELTATSEIQTQSVRSLDVRTVLTFDVGGPGWMAAHLSRDRRTLLGSVDQRGVLRVFDVDRDLEVAITSPPENPGVTYTRGEWVESPRGELAIAIGETQGFLNWYGVEYGAEPSTLKDQYGSGIAQPLVPLATMIEGEDVFVLVSSGDRMIRIRVIPGPAHALEYLPMDTETRFLRAAHFVSTEGQHLIAAISRHTIESFRLDQQHALYRGDLSHGERAWTTWFENKQVGLVVASDHSLQIHFPVGKQTPARESLRARAAGRVHALTTSGGSTFILAPTEAGAEVFLYARGELRPWATLPTAMSAHQKGVFHGPDDRVYAMWTEEPAGGVPLVHITEFAREMRDPLDSLELRPNEQVHHVQALHLPHGVMYLFIKTDARTLVREVRAGRR